MTVNDLMFPMVMMFVAQLLLTTIWGVILSKKIDRLASRA